MAALSRIPLLHHPGDGWLYNAFARMLLAGATVDGCAPLSPVSVERMTTDHLTPPQRETGELFLERQGWGFGGSVDVAAIDPRNVPGRYGWIGGTGTAAHVTPSTGTVSIVLSQLEMAGPTAPALMRDFWRCAAGPEAGPYSESDSSVTGPSRGPGSRETEHRHAWHLTTSNHPPSESTG